jgi:hypothetical protein
MYVNVRVTYVKFGRSHMTTWGTYTHVMVANGMALNGRDEGLTWAARDGPAMHGATRRKSNLLTNNNTNNALFSLRNTIPMI